MSARVTVFSMPACVQCDATMRALSKNGIDFEIIDMSLDPAGADRRAG